MFAAVWFIIGALSYVLLAGFFAEAAMNRFPWIDVFPWKLFRLLSMFVENYLLGCVLVMGRYVTSRPMGRSLKYAVEVIIVFGAVILRQCVGYNSLHILCLVLLTIVLHAFRQLYYRHIDFGFLDLFLGALMQYGVYMQGCNTHVFAALTICGVVIFCRYLSYSCPASPINLTQVGSDVDC